MPVSARGLLGAVGFIPLKKSWAAVAACAIAGCVMPVCALSLSQLPIAQKHEAHHEIDEMEEAWRNAILTSNSTELASLLADDYMAITPSGSLQNKEDTLATLRSGHVHFSSIVFSDRKVRFYGNTAVVTSLAEIDATTADGPVAGSYRYTRVYARDAAGKWKIVSFEASHVREPGPHRRNEFH